MQQLVSELVGLIRPYGARLPGSAALGILGKVVRAFVGGGALLRLAGLLLWIN